MAWRYTVNLPLWILGKDAEGESVVVRRGRARRLGRALGAARARARFTACSASGRAARARAAAQPPAPRDGSVELVS